MHTLQAQLTILMDDAGCIPYSIAAIVARNHSLVSEFLYEYGTRDCWDDGEPLGVDLGEFMVWFIAKCYEMGHILPSSMV